MGRRSSGAFASRDYSIAFIEAAEVIMRPSADSSNARNVEYSSPDSADPERYLEIFVTASWGEHSRQQERITAEDRKVERRVQAFHVGAQPPKTTHLIAEDLPK